jgi:hypothetical protein
MSSYQDRLKAHLAAYKRDALGVTDDGVYAGNGRSYAHIVPSDKRHLNLLESCRDGVTGYLAKRPALRLHRDFHHLNSSQAMGFNLFWPAVATPEGRAALARALDCLPIAPTSPLFESMPDPAEQAHFDLHLHTRDGGQLFFELKLSEDNFGDAKADPAHLAKLGDVYLGRLQSRVRPHLLAAAEFFPRYQLLRDLSHLATDADRLFLVMPRANLRLHEQARAFLADLDEEVRAQVVVLDIETLVERLQAFAPPGDEAWPRHYREFMRKYGVAETVPAT